ncbi:MAG: hypothetical protein GX245_05020 [Eubacteriaceae bacterium]|mgnify:CR=1 FL=1|jgi:hypothetical protein|nr:hypothetical protein [Eubacteriaceae bacterium]
MKKRIWFTALVLIFSGILFSCTASHEKMLTYEANQVGALGPYQIRTLSYDDGFSLTGLKENYDTQGRFVVAEIEIVAMHSIDEGYGPLTIKAVDSAKREFALYDASEDIAERMKYESSEFMVRDDLLQAGEAKKAIFVFELPRESLTKALLITYQEESAMYSIDKARDGVNDLNICFDATKCPY